MSGMKHKETAPEAQVWTYLDANGTAVMALRPLARFLLYLPCTFHGQKLRFDARQAAETEPALASYLNATVLNHDKFSDALCYQLAQKAGVPVSEVTNLPIWGNHSATQYPDAVNAKIGGKPAYDVIDDHEWLQNGFIETVQKRGAAIIEARGLSSAASAANAAIDSVTSIWNPTPAGDCVSLAVASNGEYGTPEGLQFGFPIAADGNGGWKVVEGFELNDFAKAKIQITTDELVSERDEVRALGLIP